MGSIFKRKNNQKSILKSTIEGNNVYIKVDVGGSFDKQIKMDNLTENDLRILRAINKIVWASE